MRRSGVIPTIVSLALLTIVAVVEPRAESPQTSQAAASTQGPGAQALATAVSPEDQHEYPLVWVHEYGGPRVCGTTLGHGNDTWNDPVFQDLLRRGFRWAVNK